MGFLSGIFRSRDKPVDRTAGSSYSFFMGGSTAGKRVNERSAMQMTAVYCCVRILSEAVASLPLQFYRYNAKGGKEKAGFFLMFGYAVMFIFDGILDFQQDLKYWQR